MATTDFNSLPYIEFLDRADKVLDANDSMRIAILKNEADRLYRGIPDANKNASFATLTREFVVNPQQDKLHTKIKSFLKSSVAYLNTIAASRKTAVTPKPAPSRRPFSAGPITPLAISKNVENLYTRTANIENNAPRLVPDITENGTTYRFTEVYYNTVQFDSAAFDEIYTLVNNWLEDLGLSVRLGDETENEINGKHQAIATAEILGKNNQETINVISHHEDHKTATLVAVGSNYERIKVKTKLFTTDKQKAPEVPNYLPRLEKTKGLRNRIATGSLREEIEGTYSQPVKAEIREQPVRRPTQQNTDLHGDEATRHYRTFLNFAPEDTREVKTILNGWFAEKEITLRMGGSETWQAENRTAETLFTVKDGIRYESFALQEFNPETEQTFSTEIILVQGEAQTLLWIRIAVEGGTGSRFADAPRFVKSLSDLGRHPDGRFAFGSTSARSINRPHDVDELLNYLTSDDRALALFIVGTGNMPLLQEQYHQAANTWNKKLHGLAGLIVLSPDATKYFNSKVPEKFTIEEWGLRTYLPQLDLTSDDDSHRHRYVKRENLMKGAPSKLSPKLGRIARSVINARPIPTIIKQARILLEEQAVENKIFFEKPAHIVTAGEMRERVQHQKTKRHISETTQTESTVSEASEYEAAKSTSTTETVLEPADHEQTPLITETPVEEANDAEEISVTDKQIPKSVTAEAEHGSDTAVSSVETESGTASAAAALELIREALGITEITEDFVLELATAYENKATYEKNNEIYNEQLTRLTTDRKHLTNKIEQLTFEKDLLEEELNDAEEALDHMQYMHEISENRFKFVQTKLAEKDENVANQVWSQMHEEGPDNFEELAEKLPDFEEQGIHFTGDLDTMLDLDDYDNQGKAIKSTWSFLRSLVAYISAKKKLLVSGNYLDYLGSDVPGEKVSKHRFALGESETTMAQFGRTRLFPVPDENGIYGNVEMQSHYKVTKIGQISPRIHILDATADLENCNIYIGYIGKHLPISSSN